MEQNFKKNGCILYEKYFYMRSCAHIINLIVKDGTKQVSGSISRIRGAMKYVTIYPSRVLQLQALLTKKELLQK